MNKDNIRLKEATITFLKEFIFFLENQDEENSVLKFKEGDWIIDKEDGCVFQIIKVCDNTYEYKGITGKTYSCSHWSLENDARLWNIKDSKPGDVLVCKGNIKNSNGIKYERICLFNNLDNAFFTLVKTSNNVETYDVYVNIDYPDNTVPATKEQKEILFMAMSDAGYTFDFEKKELKKVEKKQERNEQEWSVDDERTYRSVLYNFEHHFPLNCVQQEFVKSHIQLQNTWKPSKEQIIALRWVLNNIPYNKHKEEISGLLDQIKKSIKQ